MGEPVGVAVLGTIAEVVGVPEVSPEQRVEDLRANSVTLLRLMEVLQERFDISVDVVDVFAAERAGDLVALVEAGQAR